MGEYTTDLAQILFTHADFWNRSLVNGWITNDVSYFHAGINRWTDLNALQFWLTLAGFVAGVASFKSGWDATA